MTDWYSTLLTAGGMHIPEFGDGISQWDMLQNGSESRRTELLYNIDNANGAIS